MNILKNKWALLVLAILILGSVALAFRKQLGPMLGGYIKSKRGYYYRFKSGKELEKLKGPGYHVVFQFLVLGPDGDTIENHAIQDVQYEVDYPIESKDEFHDMLQLGAPGSIIEMLIPTDTLLQRTTTNIKQLRLPPGKYAKMVFNIINLLDDGQYEAYKNERQIKKLKREYDIIDTWAKKSGKTWQLDSITNIKYIIENNELKPRFKFGDIVEFSCVVKTFNGNLVIDSESEGKKYKTQIGSETYSMPDLEKLLLFLGEGDKGTFLITSDDGYKHLGHGSLVPPYTPLIVSFSNLKKAK